MCGTSAVQLSRIWGEGRPTWISILDLSVRRKSENESSEFALACEVVAHGLGHPSFYVTRT